MSGSLQEDRPSGEFRRHRSARRRSLSPLLLFLKAYWVEVLIVAGLILAIFLLFEQMNIRAALVRGLGAMASGGQSAIARVFASLTNFRSRLGLSELVAIPMLIAVSVLLVYRLRWRLQHTESVVSLHCPRCGGALHRVHRRFSDKAISILVPVRRYRCASPDCGWSGRRVSTHTGRRRPTPSSH
jgi:predicted RNA-binding Zn-ribbon protein involved in translation (DUF1610 family)